jgi:transposase
MDFTEENFNRLLAQTQRQEAEIRLLSQKVQLLLQKLFGSKSEKLNPDQMALEFGTEAVVPGAPEAPQEVEEVCAPRKAAKRKPLVQRLPDDLPVIEVVIEPAEVQAEPESFKRIGEEVFEELDVTPAQFFKRRIIRPKYVRVDNRMLPPVVAPAPKRIIDNSYASAGLLTNIVLSKYCDHLPLYRQEQIFKSRYGVELSRQTMSDWMYHLAQMLAMVYEALREELRAQHYLQIDETPIRYLDPGSGRCGQGYLWVYHAPKVAVLFEWRTSRSNECLEKTLTGFSGIAQSDGYSAYRAFEKRHPDASIELAACWAHVRRKFYDARNESAFAAQTVQEIGNLYRIESALREHPELDRRAARQEQSLPMLERIELQLRDAQQRHLPQSLTRKAIDYTLGLWSRLLIYTKHAEVEIDNNLVENAIRPTAAGKKNWLFFGSAGAGQTSAILYSLLETCRKLGVNPEEYLRDILPCLPEMTNRTARNYTPAQWKASRQTQQG